MCPMLDVNKYWKHLRTYFYYRWLPRGFRVHPHLPILFDVRGIPYDFLIGLLRSFGGHSMDFLRIRSLFLILMTLYHFVAKVLPA